MPLPERVLIDKSAFYALLSATDTNHEIALNTYERLIVREQELWTTSYVLIDILSFIHNRLGLEPMRTFVESIRGIVHIFWVEASVNEEALEQMMEMRSTGLNVVDWATATIAKRLWAYVFTFNRSFAELGIPVLPR